MYQHQQASPEKFTKQQQKKRGFGEVTGKVVGVSKMSAGNYMQERYNHVIHVTRQNKGEKMQTLGVQKGGL